MDRHTPRPPADSLIAIARALADGRISRREFVRRAAGLGVALEAIGVLLAACGPAPREDAGDPDRPLGPIEPELAIYNWSDYIAPDTIPSFEREFGVRVTYDVYESGEEMVAKLAAGARGYDLVVPPGYLVPVLVALGLVRPLRWENIPNSDNLAPLFRAPPFDRGNVYTVPWQWGTTGLAYRADLVPEPPTSWGVFYDGRYRGKMTQLDDMRDAIGAWLRYRGHSLNATDPAALAGARADALAAKGNLKAYVSAPVKGQLVSGDVWIAQLWNGDAVQARTEQPAVAFALPTEGSAIWTDSLVVTRHAPHPRAAHEFMNYILRPEVGAAISAWTGYGTPNRAAYELLDDPVPYPTAEELRRLEYAEDLGTATALWDQIWTEIKVG